VDIHTCFMLLIGPSRRYKVEWVSKEKYKNNGKRMFGKRGSSASALVPICLTTINDSISSTVLQSSTLPADNSLYSLNSL